MLLHWEILKTSRKLDPNITKSFFFKEIEFLLYRKATSSLRNASYNTTYLLVEFFKAPKQDFLQSLQLNIIKEFVNFFSVPKSSEIITKAARKFNEVNEFQVLKFIHQGRFSYPTFICRTIFQEISGKFWNVNLYCE